MPELRPLDLYPPVGYPTPWMIVAWVCVAVALLLPVAVVLATRPRAEKPVPPPPPPPPADLRRDALAALAEVADAHRAGRIGDREAHSRISVVVRDFVGSMTGTPAENLTLAELRELVAAQPRLAPAADVVELLYPPTFAPGAQRPVAESLADAEGLVSRWN